MKFLGTARRQLSEEYRMQQTRSLISFGVYFREENVKCINVDLVPEQNIQQTGYNVVCAFK